VHASGTARRTLHRRTIPEAALHASPPQSRRPISADRPRRTFHKRCISANVRAAMTKRKVLTLLKHGLERDGFDVATYFKGEAGETIQGTRPISPRVLEIVQGTRMNANGHNGIMILCGVHLSSVEHLFREEQFKQIPIDSWMRSMPLPLRPSLYDEHWIDAAEATSPAAITFKIDDVLAASRLLALRLFTPASIREELQKRRPPGDPELLLWLATCERAEVH
jgi:hypothetical protein